MGIRLDKKRPNLCDKKYQVMLSVDELAGIQMVAIELGGEAGIAPLSVSIRQLVREALRARGQLAIGEPLKFVPSKRLRNGRFE